MLEEQKFEFCEEKALSEQQIRQKQTEPDLQSLPRFGASRGHVSEPETKSSMVYCTFSGIKEQTPADERSSSLPSSPKDRRNRPQTKDMRCFYKDSHLTVVTRGGLKYVNNLRLEIDKVFPMEDGLLIRAIFNSDLISFELGANPPIFHKKHQSGRNNVGGLTSAERTYVYLSLLEHPLNEAYPVNLTPFQATNASNAEQQHVNSGQLIFEVAPALPLCLMYDPERKTTRICLICRYSKGRSVNNPLAGGDSIDSLNYSGKDIFREHNDARQAHPQIGLSFNSSQQNSQGAGFGQLPQIFGPSQVSIVTQFEVQHIQSESPPDKVHICRGLSDSREMTVSLFFKEAKSVIVLACKVGMDAELQFEQKAFYTNIDAMESLDYSVDENPGQSKNSSKVVSRNLLKRLSGTENGAAQSSCKEVYFFVKRLNQLRSDTAMLNLSEGVLNVCAGGYTQVRSIELPKLLQSLSIPGQVTGICDAQNSNIQLCLADGTQRRVTLKCNLTDFTVKSILKVLKRILPHETYHILRKDVVSLFTATSLSGKGFAPADQFEKFANFLVSLLCGKESSILSRHASELAKIVQSSTVMQTQGSQWQSQQVKTIQGQKKGPSAIGQSSFAEIVARKRLSVAQAPASAQKKTSASSKAAAKRTSQVDTIAGSVPNAFSLMLQSDFSVDFIGSNPLMFSSDVKDRAMNPGKQSKPEEAPLKKAAQSKQKSPQKQFASPQKNTSTASPLKRKAASGAKTQTGKTTELARKKESTAAAKANQLQPSFLLKSEDLQPYAEKIFHVLHLLYEDLKLDRLRFQVEGRKVRRLLLAWLLEETYCPQKTAYVAYYLSESDAEDPQVRTLFEEELSRHASYVRTATDVELEQVPNIMHWLHSQLSSSDEILDFPICFEQTRVVCRLYQVLFHKEASYFMPLCDESEQPQIEDSLMEGGDPIVRQILISKHSALYTGLGRSDWANSSQDYLMLKRQSSFSDLHLFEKVLYTMKEETLGIEEIASWPALVALPLYEVIRYTRLHLQDIQTIPWPVSLYRLIHREDIINNLMQSDPQAAMSLAPGTRAQQNLIKTQGQKLLRQQSAEIKRATFKRRQSKEYALNRHESNVFSPTDAEQMGFAAQLIDEELQQTKMQNAIVQELIGGEEEEQQDKQPVGITGKAAQDGNSGAGLSVSNQMNDFLRNKFGKDTRYKEVEHMLSSSHNMAIKVDSLLGGNQADQQSINETERQRQIKTQLEKVFRRHLSKCTGRGALTLGTQETIPTETLEIPKISQSGQLANFSPNELSEAQVGSSVISLDLTREEREQLQWPSFHNGAASALRIAQSCFKRGTPARSAVSPALPAPQNQSGLNQTRNWIMYHKPQEPRNEHGGFLLGIGLLGQLDSLQAPDLYQHLKSAHDTTTIGILLGRAASQMGKKDDSDTRMMCLHIPALLPQNLLVDISLPVQSAAVVSAGMLYQGTQNRLISEMLIAQIARKPTSDKMIEREGYALASGIALGLVNLASSNKSKKNAESENLPSILGIQVPAQNARMQDLQLDERLIRFIEGGSAMPLPRSMLSNAQQHEGNKSSAIKENDMVNVYVTGSAGIMALALTHLKSNNQDIAQRLVMPHTFYDMEFVMPQILLQKVLCKNLILWENIQCSQDWLDAQIPPLIREIYEADFEQVMKKFSARVKADEVDFATVALCYVNIIAGATFSIGFKYAGTGSQDAKALIINQIEFFRKKLKVVPGTQPSGGPILTNTTPETKNQVDKATVETCLCVLAFSLGLVMAGTCDIEAFRQLRVLRKRLEGEMHYGYNLAVNMAIGFLFLGSGAYTFSRSERAIAALLISTYPILPSNASDNRFHLQALRHFYVLAIETRLLQAKDIDTGKFVNIDVIVKVRDECTGQISTVQQQTPNIINGQIIQIEVRNHPEYHDVCQQVTHFSDDPEDEKMDVDFFESKKNTSQNSDGRFEQSALQQVIYVKRKTYQESESKEEKNQLAVTSVDHLLSTNISMDDLQKRSVEALEKLTQVKDPSIRAFIKAFIGQVQRNDIYQDLLGQIDRALTLQTSLCKTGKDSPQSRMSYSQKKRVKRKVRKVLENELKGATMKRQLLTLVALEECYVQDKVQALPLFLRLFDKQVRPFDQAANNDSLELLPAYGAFMKKANSQFSFIADSPQILPQEFSQVKVTKAPFKELSILAEYVTSSGGSFLSATRSQLASQQLTELAQALEPCLLQMIKLALTQAHDQLSQISTIDHEQMVALLRQIARECLLTSKLNTSLASDEQALDTIISATLNHRD